MKKFLAVLIVLSTFTAISAQSKLTLNEAISIALQRNSSLIKSKNGLSASKQNLKNAYGDLLPNLGLNGSWGWSQTNDAGGTQIGFFGEEINIPPSEIQTRNYSLSVSGGVTLFDGLANYSNITKKHNDLKSAKLDFAKLKQDIVFATTELYYTILNAEELLKVRKDNVEYNKKLLETIQERNKLGSVPLADVYAQQVQLGNSELLLIQAENTFENSQSTLLNYLALDVLQDYDFVDPFKGTEPNLSADNEFSDLNSMVDEALANRYDYQSQKLALENTKETVSIAKSGYMPVLSGNYSYGTSATDLSRMFDRKVLRVGLNLNLPIFSRFNTETDVELASVQEKNAMEDLLALERQIKIQIKQGYLDYQAAKKQLEVSKKNVVSAGETRKVNNEKYSLGSGTILEVLQADRDYTDALRQNIDAEYNYYKLRDQLINFLGKLDYSKYE